MSVSVSIRQYGGSIVHYNYAPDADVYDIVRDYARDHCDGKLDFQLQVDVKGWPFYTLYGSSLRKARQPHTVSDIAAYLRESYRFDAMKFAFVGTWRAVRGAFHLQVPVYVHYHGMAVLDHVPFPRHEGTVGHVYEAVAAKYGYNSFTLHHRHSGGTVDATQPSRQELCVMTSTKGPDGGRRIEFEMHRDTDALVKEMIMAMLEAKK